MKIVKTFCVLLFVAFLLQFAMCSRSDKGSFNQWIAGGRLSVNVKTSEQGLTLSLRNRSRKIADISPLNIAVTFADGRELKRICIISRISTEQVTFTCGSSSGAAIITHVNSAATLSSFKKGAKLLGGEEVSFTPLPAFDPEMKDYKSISSVTIAIARQRFMAAAR
jgi:hypothetical protein